MENKEEKSDKRSIDEKTFQLLLRARKEKPKICDKKKDWLVIKCY